jgi:uncharacterized protein (DUF2164 family)
MNKSYLPSKDMIRGIFNEVFRQSTNQAGFYYLNMGANLDSKVFRQTMVDIKNALSALCKQHLKRELLYQSLGRFNHQSSSKPHRDTADDHSFLILGYEPTVVESKAYITDYSKYIEDKGISKEQFFEEDKEANLVKNISVLTDYTIEIKPFNKEHFRILIANNSRSYIEATYGVFHSAEIPEKLHDQDRVINYMMLRLSDLNSKEQYTRQNVQEFVSTDKVNR